MKLLISTAIFASLSLATLTLPNSVNAAFTSGFTVRLLNADDTPIANTRVSINRSACACGSSGEYEGENESACFENQHIRASATHNLFTDTDGYVRVSKGDWDKGLNCQCSYQIEGNIAQSGYLYNTYASADDPTVNQNLQQNNPYVIQNARPEPRIDFPAYSAGFSNDTTYHFTIKKHPIASISLTSPVSSCQGQTPSVPLNWSTNSNEFSAFAIYRRGGGTQSFITGDLSADSRSFVDTTASPNTTYEYWIYGRINRPTGTPYIPFETWSNNDIPVTTTTPTCETTSAIPSANMGFTNPRYGDITSRNITIISTEPGNLQAAALLNGQQITFWGTTPQPSGTVIKTYAIRTDGQTFSCPTNETFTTNDPTTGRSAFVCKLQELTSLQQQSGHTSYGSLHWTPPNNPAEYYVWIDLQPAGTNNACTGGRRFNSNFNRTTPTLINNKNYYYCGNSSSFTLSTATAPGSEVNRCTTGTCGIESARGSAYALSGATLAANNPIYISPQFNYTIGGIYPLNTINLIGTAFLPPSDTPPYSITDMEQRASNGEGFILIGVNNETTIPELGTFLSNSYHIYYNPGNWVANNLTNWLQLYPGIERTISKNLSPVLKIRPMITDIGQLDTAYRAELLPALGSHSWDIVDFVQTSNGFRIIKQLSCEEGREPACQ